MWVKAAGMAFGEPRGGLFSTTWRHFLGCVAGFLDRVAGFFEAAWRAFQAVVAAFLGCVAGFFRPFSGII